MMNTASRRMRMAFGLITCAVTMSGLLAGAFAGEPRKAVALFNGQNLDGWRIKGTGKPGEFLVVGKATLDPKNPKQFAIAPGGHELINPKGGQRDFYTAGEFGSGTIEVEFMVPQGSNSGVYVMGEYEVQILDSFGKKTVGAGDVGGLYGAAAPKVNAARKPGEWQKFVIEFRAPKFEGKKKVANAKFLKVTLNGQVIHENVEMKGPTPGGLTGKEHATGPLMFQGNHGPVAFRKLKVTPAK